MKRLSVVIAFLISYASVAAQDKILTMEDALVKNRTTLLPESLKQLQFLYGTNDYIYLNKGDKEWLRGNFDSPVQTFLTLEQLNSILTKNGYAPIKTMPGIQFNKSKELVMSVDGDKVAVDFASAKVRTVIGKSITAKAIVDESDAGNVAYVDQFNLFVKKGDDVKQVTTDGSDNIVYASSVHREEFGIIKGTFWSHSGNLLAFYRMDQSMVTDYPIIDWSVRPARNINIKYPMAGDKSHHVTVGIYNVEKKSLVYLKTGEPVEQYLTNIAWSPDDKYVYMAVLNRDQNHMLMNQYDAVTGDFIKTLFEENDEKYVEPLVPMLFVKNTPGRFIWQSNRDGWNHLYLYDVNGNLKKQLTSGKWEVTEVKGFNQAGDELYYVSTEESPLSRQLFKLNINTGRKTQITLGSGIHTTQLSTNGNLVLDNYNNASVPRKVSLINTTNNKSTTLLVAANPLSEFVLGSMSIFTINNNGTLLYSRLFKPIHFDSLHKYPVIVYWYGGSHAQLVNNGWNGGASDYWFQAMAERGFVVFTLDTRGSDNRGKLFEQSMFRRLGDVQMEDMKIAVDYLKRQPFVDSRNMGLFGWSFGGFNTIDYMLNHAGDFKAAVAGGPVTDWRYYEIMYTERYMDTPQQNPEGYAATDLTQQVDKLRGKLLLIHGLQDNTVVQEHSVRFVRAAIDKNIQVDYMIYPGHEHNVLGKDRAHLYEKITNYFMENLTRPGQ